MSDGCQLPEPVCKPTTMQDVKLASLDSHTPKISSSIDATPSEAAIIAGRCVLSG